MPDPQPSAQFTVNGSAVTGEIAVAAGSTVNLALANTFGASTVQWSFIGSHDPDVTYPTITKTGYPSGVTASFVMPAGAGGQGFLLKCTINGGRDLTGSINSAQTATALIGVSGGGGGLPFVFNETFERGDFGYVPRLNDKLSGFPTSVTTFGAVGDGVTDDTAAILAWLAALESTGKAGLLPAGVYRIVDTSITLPEGVRIYGQGATKIAAFSQQSGAKAFLRPGYKDQIPGSVLLFDGTGDATYTTVRSDRFADPSYCVRYPHLADFELHDLAIIKDVDVLDAGGSLTTGSTDNDSDYDVGLIVQSAKGHLNNVTVFGYFPGAGVWIHNEAGDTPIDPDYITLTNPTITSGLAITGHDTATGASSEGLTGVRVIGGTLQGADHHTRADGDYTVPALYIDGYVTGSIGGIRGHSFIGTSFRTYANDAIVFDHADDVQFSAPVFEFPVLAGVTNADAAGGFVGTANTKDGVIFGGAATAQPDYTTFLAAVAGHWTIADGKGTISANGGAGSGSGYGVRIAQSGDDSIVQLTKDFGSTVSDWTIRRDDSDSDRLSIRYDNATVFSITPTGTVSAARNVDAINTSVGGGTPKATICPQRSQAVATITNGGNANQDLAISVDGVFKAGISIVLKRASTGDYRTWTGAVEFTRASSTVTLIGTASAASTGDSTGLTITVSGSGSNLRVNIANATGESVSGYIQLQYLLSDLVA